MSFNTVYEGDVFERIKELPDECINCVVTSPPYWGLRDYGTASWEGGDATCDHVANPQATKKFGNPEFNENRPSREETKTAGYYEDVCPKCGAKRVDSQLGLESTPQEYVDRMVVLFREIRRVLRKDGTVWLNIGDSYMAAKNVAPPPQTISGERGMPKQIPPNRRDQHGLKTKDLVGIPWRVALALQADGWWLRSDIIWHKPNPMPESVTDRPTKSHEYIFLLSKSSTYYYDAEAIKEPAAYDGRKDTLMKGGTKYLDADATGQPVHTMASRGHERWLKNEEGLYVRNKRDVWSVNTKPFPGAHFAVYPEELIEPCIKAGSPFGGVVLDPFLGSGTTAIVAKKLRREYVGFELNPEYAAMARERIRTTEANKTLDEFGG